MNKKDALSRLTIMKDEIKKLEEIINAPVDLFKEVKRYSDVCRLLEEKEYTLEDFQFLPEYLRKKTLATVKISQFEKLFNQEIELDWSNINQPKYYPYFDTSSGRLVFYSCCDHCYHCGGVVAYFKDRNTAEFVGKIAIDIYADLQA